jgi:hypothetical protein
MVNDPKNDGGSSNDDKKQKKGGLNPLLLFLPLILKFLLKRPKLLFPILIIAGIAYFFRGSLFGEGGQEDSSGYELFQGLEMDPAVYEKSDIYEPLATEYKSSLPSKVSLEQYCPTRRNQGRQGSCVGWASSYAARTILESKATGKDPNSVVFSPASLYNQISLPGCQGAYIDNAMNVMYQRGVLPWKDFGYDENDCSREPNSGLQQKAQQFRTRGFQRLSEQHGTVDVAAIKQNIAQGAPVVIGMMVGGSFMQGMQNRKMWQPSRSDYYMQNFGGHAMCVIGYDDNYQGGSFEIMNSWGESWGDRGFAWVSYKDFAHFTKEAYGLYPMGNKVKEDPTKFSVDIGLLSNDTKTNIPLSESAYGVYQTTQKVPKGTTFKVEFSNNIECYTYIFGEETDGSTYVLFPYTAKHSPYFGITGTRLFPRTESLMVDELGSKDKIFVIVSKTPLDFNDINAKMNQSSGDFIKRILAAVGNILIEDVAFTGGNLVHFDANVTSKSAVGLIIEVQK